MHSIPKTILYLFVTILIIAIIYISCVGIFFTVFAGPQWLDIKWESNIIDANHRNGAISPENYYGYTYLHGLDDAEAMVRAYEMIAQGVAEHKPEIKLWNVKYRLSPEEASRVYNIYVLDNPQVFWINYEHTVKTFAQDVLSISPGYTFSAQEVEVMQVEIEKKTEFIMEQIKDLPIDQKELFIHDYIVSTVDCDVNEKSLYSALVKGKSNCNGYAGAFAYLMREAGVPCIVVYGTVFSTGGAEGGAHAWNMVNVNDSWCSVDACFDDADKSTQYKYYNVTNDDIAETRIAQPIGYAYPE